MVRTAPLCLLVAVSVGVAARAADKASAGRNGQGILPGDRFLVRIEYTNTWSDESLTRKPSAGARVVRPASRAPLVSTAPATRGTNGATPQIPVPPPPPQPPARAVTNGHEPLKVTMTFEGDIRDGGRIDISTAVERVHYWDGEGTDWEIDARLPDATSRATEMARRLAGSWSTASPGLHREFLEEQLLGVAVVLLDGGSFDVDLGPGGPELDVLRFEDLLEERLPREYPYLLRHPVAAFFLEAVRKTFAPNAAEQAPGEGPGERDPRYRVQKQSTVKGRPALTAFGKEYDRVQGIGFSDLVTFDARSGLVLERKFLRRQDTIRGPRVRFGATHWTVRLERFVEGPPGRPMSK